MESTHKAYIVGSKEGINRFLFGIPEHDAEIVCIEKHGRSTKAKTEYLKQNFFDLKYIDLFIKRSKKHDKYSFEGKSLSKNQISEIESNREYRRSLKEFVENNKGNKVMIFSGQWGSYWRKDRSGYTHNIEEAGIYDIKEAYDNVAHCGMEKQIQLVIVKEPLKPNDSFYVI